MSHAPDPPDFTGIGTHSPADLDPVSIEQCSANGGIIHAVRDANGRELGQPVALFGE
jgi:hypothetical protein